MVMPPLKVLLPKSDQLPPPFLTRLTTPAPLSLMRLLSRLLTLLAVPALRVRVRACPVEPHAMSPVLVKLSRAVALPVPLASMVELAETVKRRSVAPAAAPEKRRVPPARTRLAAALVELPMVLGLPPLARVVTSKTPSLMVVGRL